MKKIYCNICEKKFGDRDEYVNGKMILTYTEYLGDDGSSFVGDDNDLCEKCLSKIIRYMEEIKKK
jgi:hypothetical protein